jgi:hypothetical protein
MTIIKESKTVKESIRWDDRLKLVEEARESIEDAIDKIKRAVKGTGQVESNCHAYILGHLQAWLDGRENGYTIEKLIDYFNEPSNDPDATE